MYEPEVTIITPTYNIIEAGQTDDFTLLLDLMNRQTYPYIEHLVMDNASTDGTLDILKEYKNSGYISFYSAPDNGKFDAINKGLLHAKGKYVAFLSCDDFYHDITGIYDVVNLMEANDADFCYFPSYCVQEDGNVFLFNPSPYNVFQVMPFPRQAMFVKRDTLAKLGNFDSKFKMFADYDLMLKLFLNNAKGIFFDGCIVTYKMAVKAIKYPSQMKAETSHIFHQNFRNLYPVNENMIDRIVNIGEIPKPLLDKLAKVFPEDEKLFYERYQQMYDIRLQTAETIREQEKQHLHLMSMQDMIYIVPSEGRQFLHPTTEWKNRT